MRFLSGLAFLLCIIFCLAFAHKTGRPDYTGQRCPPDMEFIPGNDSIPSFFIGKSQETNMDWALYLNWLRNVYQDYPYVEALATPHEIEYSELSRCNDPLLTSQMYNPAFAYYPVTGCDWIQIQNYLTWKTDRMNEYILVKTGQLAFNPGQSGDFTFNTEAYLAGQYG